MQLVEEFPQSPTFNIGEPITRTLLIIADGQNSSQLPEFITRDVKGLKQYPDKPLLKNNINDDGLTGVQQIKVALIPSSAGTYTLPEITVPWWNTQTDKLEIARIEARTFTVSPASGSVTIDNQQPKINPIVTNNTPDTIHEPIIKPISVNTPDNSLPWKISSLLLSIGLLFTLFLLWKNKSITPSTSSATQNTDPSVKQALKALKLSCDNADAQASKNALISWAQALFIKESIHSLGDLSSKVDKEFAEKINSLNSHLYCDNSQPWQCNNLFDLCVKFTENVKTH